MHEVSVGMDSEHPLAFKAVSAARYVLDSGMGRLSPSLTFVTYPPRIAGGSTYAPCLAFDEMPVAAGACATTREQGRSG